MKAPSLWTLGTLLKVAGTVSAKVNGRWVSARPIGLDSWQNRFRLAWMVFTGKADAVKWPEGQ